jgi:hypothetical protein
MCTSASKGRQGGRRRQRGAHSVLFYQRHDVGVERPQEAAAVPPDRENGIRRARLRLHRVAQVRGPRERHPVFQPVRVLPDARRGPVAGDQRCQREDRVPVDDGDEGRDGRQAGVDDYLARGYGLEDLTVENAYPDGQGEYFEHALRITPSEERVLKWLLRHQGNRGAFLPDEVARKLRINRKTVWRSYRRFEELGFMRVWEGWAVETDDGYRTRPHAYVMFELIHGYWEWVRSIRVPLPVQRRLGVTTAWTPVKWPR